MSGNELFCELISSLLECTLDPEELVKHAVQDSLTQLGLEKPALVIEACHLFLCSRLKCTPDDVVHCILPLMVIDELVSEKLNAIEGEEILRSLIPTLIELLSYDKFLEHSSNVLVNLSTLFCKDILEALLTVLSGFSEPNKNIITISGRLASDNPRNVMQILPVLLSQTMTQLPQTTDDSLLSTLISALGRYCDSAIEFLISTEKSDSSWITIVDLFSNYCSSAVSVCLHKVASHTRNTELLSIMLTNIGSIITLTEWDFLHINLPKVLNCLLTQLKKANMNTELPVISSLNSIFRNLTRRYPIGHATVVPSRSPSPSLPNTDDTASQQLSGILEGVLDSTLNCLWNQLFSLHRRSATHGPRDVLTASDKTYNEIKRAFTLLCSSYPSRVLQCTFSHLHSASDSSRAVLLDVLRHLIASCDRNYFTNDHRQLVLNNLLQLLLHSPTSSSARRRVMPRTNLMGTVVQASPLGTDDHAFSVGNVASGQHLPPDVRYELAKIIITMGDLDYLHLGGKQYVFVEFVVRQCAISSLPSDKVTSGCTTQNHVRNLCARVLRLGSTTVPSMQRLLWPYLMEFLLVSECTEAVGVVCDSVVNILSKPLVANDSTTSEDRLIDPMELRLCEKFPSPHRFLARLLVLLGWPMHGNIRGLPILQMLQCLSSFFHPTLPAFWDAVLPRMIRYLSQCQEQFARNSDAPSGCTHNEQPYNQGHWEELTLKMLSKSIEQVADESWTLALLRALESQLSFYENSSADKGFLFKCESVLLRKIQDKQVISDSVSFIFSSTNHDVALEQASCAVALGRICDTHLHAVYELLSSQLERLNHPLPVASKIWRTQPRALASGSRPFPGLFRSTSTSVNLSSLTLTPNKPVTSGLKGSLDQAKATILWSYALSLSYLPPETLVQHVENLIETIISPIIIDPEAQVSYLQVATLGLISHMALAMNAQLSTECTSFTPEFLVQVRTELFHQIVSILYLLSNASGSETTDPLDNPSVIPFPSLLRTICKSTVPDSFPTVVCDAALLAAEHVVVLSVTADDSLDASELLRLTAELVFSLPVCSDDERSRSSSPEMISGPETSDTSTIFNLLLLSQQSTTILNEYSRCCVPLHTLWTSLLRIYFSDALISTMYKILIPYLYDTSPHVQLRAIRLLNVVLAAILQELGTVSKKAAYNFRMVGSAPSLTGQLLVHLVASLSNTAIRHEIESALGALLMILRFSCEDTAAEHKMGVPYQPTYSADLLIWELVRITPRSHVDDLWELIYAGLTNSILAITNSESVPADFGEAENLINSSNSAALKAMWRVGRADTFCRPGQHTQVPNVMLQDMQSVISRLKIPPSSQGYLVKLFLSSVYRWKTELSDQQVSSILHSIHSVLPHLADPSLRIGLLQAISELGNRWPKLCLKIISQNTLPLDDTWCTLLASLAFLPSDGLSMGDKCASAASSPRISSARVPTTHGFSSSSVEVDMASRQPIFHSLLTHVLDSLECCHPYEQREIPIYHPSSTVKQLSTSSPPYDGPATQEANFATHFWLSLVNCLQVLSYPLPAEYLMDRCSDNTSTLLPLIPQTSHQKSKLRKKFFGRSDRVNPAPSHAVRAWLRRAPSPLCDYFAEPQLFCRVLGHWILACATAAKCRTLSGKSYEIRSGAEANLQLGIKPSSIAVDGLLHFIDACGLSKLYDQLSISVSEASFTPNDSTLVVTSDTIETTGGAVDNLRSTIRTIIKFLSDFLQPSYTFGLVKFFLPHLQSTYNIRRIVAITVLVAVLCHLDYLRPHWATSTMISMSPDSLLENLLHRLDDDASEVRFLVIKGVGEIAESVCSPTEVGSPPAAAESLSHTVAEHCSRATLMRRQSPNVIRSLLSILNGRRQLDDSTFLVALHTLSSIVPCSTEPQVRILVPDLCACLLPVYSAPDPRIRSGAFRLFAILSCFAWEDSPSSVGKKPSSSYQTLYAESHSVFVPLTLHLMDPDPEVVQTCKSSLKTVSSLLFSLDDSHPSHTRPLDVSSNRLVDFLHNCLRPDTKLHHGEFFNEFARLLANFQPTRVADYTVRCSVYFNSDCPEIQCGALLFASSLIAHFPEDILARFSRAQILGDIIQLLRCRNPDVRATAAHAVSRFRRF